MLYIFIVIVTLITGLISFKIFHYKYISSSLPQSDLIPNPSNIVGQGGIVFTLLLSFFFLIDYFYTLLNINYNIVPRIESIFVAIAILTILSYFDDKFDLPKRIRFFFQIVLTFLATSAINIDPTLIPLKIQILFIVLFWCYIINITNFIDGLNGFLCLNSISFFIGSLLIIYENSLFNEVIFPLSLISLLLMISFIVFNFPKPRIFFGDTGAIPLGFLIGYILIYFFSIDLILPALFIFLYPITDVTVTLLDKVFIRKRYPWERLFDYFFLKPVINRKKSHEFVFYTNLIFQILNLTMLTLYLIFDISFIFLISVILAFINIKFYSNFKKIS